LTDRDRPGLQPANDLERRFRHIVGKKLTKTKGFAQFYGVIGDRRQRFRGQECNF
jgi:hypothetical protein